MEEEPKWSKENQNAYFSSKMIFWNFFNIVIFRLYRYTERIHSTPISNNKSRSWKHLCRSHLPLLSHGFEISTSTSAIIDTSSPENSTYSSQKFSGLSWMVRRYYIQDYPEYFRGNTKTRTIASDFIWPSVKSSITRRDSRNAHGEGWWLTWTIRTEALHKLSC